ncbi:MAG TPA: hypothetical protein VEZ17_07630 [Chitinophagaceae bacterium]|jgi:hypothetical protein|nr:hypothetical protein [Chitinophagaceae bacterium]
MRILISSAIFIVFSSVTAAQEKLQYHNIKTDKEGKIIPWYNPDPGISYDRMMHLVWNFWDTMRVDLNGIPYYMNHQVWRPGVNDPRGAGGDQFAMALSSWRLYYQYTGNERVKQNMKFIAEYYLTHSLSDAGAKWPHIPYPYNTFVYSGIFDGDMIIGKNYTQPDKAGSFGIELVNMYKLLRNERYPNQSYNAYLSAAVDIANTLASHIQTGDSLNSPLPFKVNAITGEVGTLKRHDEREKDDQRSSYTTNWAGTMELFLELQKLNAGNVPAYQKGFDQLLQWMKTYPLKNNRWGPFFEDIVGWSDTQINAVTFAQFMMNHPEYFPEWRKEVKGIFDWVYLKLGNPKWQKYGVTPVNEQTAYRVPGNSHSSRQASAELQFMALTGDRSGVDRAIRQLNWATYMVDVDGKNRYMEDENWLTDGYGDFVRHYLRSMAAMPELAPATDDHLLSTTSVVQHIFYRGQMGKYYYPMSKDTQNIQLHYTVYDDRGTEQLRLMKKPSGVLFDDKKATENNKQEGYEWNALSKGGILTVRRTTAKNVVILK